ncbi:dimethylarginine dimethylaminohydrolase family protein [Actinomycetospora cinnamomea]|uniref:N-dimethylarginine dimethylaminohydrolase n=1 Tax=Actinomycetospora cinnamomea TaxID=663609 RepID=A0A2U1F646_9PSEU|nr:amidinotransferase [Actinomycetospora cinnamomea]PVZ07651.1 N-dimethylarginine dimethylaminohydrolase [Actinomycetospora cinnamomea]
MLTTHLLVSDARHFRIDYVINPYMDTADQPDPSAAAAEHEALVDAHVRAARTVERMPTVAEHPDMVYTANGAVVVDGVAVLGDPPPPRRGEIPHHRRALGALGLQVLDAPFPFSGQGDALACGDLLLAGHGRRTDPRMLPFLAEHLEREVVPLRTAGPEWYDLDLAVGVLDAATVAWFPDALDGPSRRRLDCMAGLAGVDLVEVSRAEAEAFALNLVSDGRTVTMTTGAPRLADRLRDRGYTVDEVATDQLRKGGGGVRCTALTLDGVPGETTDPAADVDAVARPDLDAVLAAGSR